MNKAYKFMDRDDLYEIIDEIEEAMKCIHDAEEALDGVEFVGKAGILEELADIANDLADELPDVQEAAADADRAEERAEVSEYVKSVFNSWFDDARSTSFWDKYIQI